MKRILLAGAAFAALSTAAMAADMPIMAPEAALAPVDIWSGQYAGIQGGFAWGEFDDDTLADTFDAEGGFGGLYYGSNWQFGNWVLGLDGSVSFADISVDDDAYPAGDDFKIQGFSASRARVGYAFDNVLLYAAGGFSLARAELDVAGVDDDQWLKGFTVGAGLETKFAENWSARIEYMYFNWGDEDFDVPAAVNIDVEDTHMIRAGIAYHFNLF
ncbi:outer membrane protein [Flaviflagellibacter deserti]|uniref:Outer membrane protein n=1 Tax=Flaviflagellibacter deserti TaxID=2267266 RepID=A0ABV9Z3U7_9HYPH